MNKRNFIVTTAAAGLLTSCSTIQPSNSTKGNTMIVHSVFFKLKHPAGSETEKAFLTKAAELSSIQGVENFQVLKETSPKNSFDFGLSMEFKDQGAYDAYNTHPDHVAFVQNIWIPEVEDFQEIDYVAYSVN